jgi:hypothetical protein
VNESIRDYLKRRVRWCLALAFAGWLVFALSAAAAHGKPDPALIALGFTLFGGAIAAMQWTIKCPKCGAKLGQTIAMQVAFSWGSGPQVGYCPFCGVNLDEPRPQPAGPAG